jgi:hypothetical protein
MGCAICRADRAHQADVELADIAAGDGSGRGLDEMPRAIDLLEMRSQRPAERRQLYRPAISVHELTTELRLQALYGLRQRRLRHMALLGRTREIQRVGQGEEISDLIEVHGASIPRSLAPTLGKAATVCATHCMSYEQSYA